jgi:hypothetical protein
MRAGAMRNCYLPTAGFWRLPGVRHDAFEVVLINHCGYGPFAVLFSAANNPSGTVDQDVSISSNHHRGQHNAEANDRPHRKLGIHVEQNAAG